MGHSRQCTCTLPLSQAPSHSASLLLIFALTSPSHLFTLSHNNLFSHGVVDRMSGLKKLRLTTTYPRMAFAESTSLELPPQGLRVKKFHVKKNPGCKARASPLRIFALRSSQA